MNKSIRNFWVDMLLLGLLGGTLVSFIPEHITWIPIHTLLGLTLAGGAFFHLWIHWDWIRVAFQRFASLPQPAQANALIDLILLLAYLGCASLGLSARLFGLHLLPLHVLATLGHILLAVVILIFQCLHLARHWKWIAATAQRLFGPLSRQP